jgi:glucose/arabinose dehydrogenase
MALILLLALLPLLSCADKPLPAAEVYDSQQQRFRVVPVVQGLENPWGMSFLPDGSMLVSERPGRLRIIKEGRLMPEPVAGLPANLAVIGQGGLLDVALHPGFDVNRLVYFSYAGSGNGGWGTEVARGRLEGTALQDVEVIFRALPKSQGGRHFGSRLLFAPDGTLYVTLGERGSRDRAQDLGDHAGSVIRLTDDGGVPKDNPFVTVPGARPEIFTYGHRNIQGVALQPESNLIWMHEHGPRGGDEVNIVGAGRNYGWPVITYGIEYSGLSITDETARPGMEQPVHYWVPSIAPSGMMFYSGDKFPAWRGDLFVGALKAQLLVRLEIEGNRVVAEERMLSGRWGRIRDVRQGPDGFIYLLTDEPDGALLRLEPERD